MQDHSHHQHEEKDNRVSLQVEGMTCAHCALTVTKVLENNGAKHPNVNFATGEASFSLDSKVNMATLSEAVSKAGYKVISSNEKESKTSGVSSLEKKFLFTLPFTIVLFFSHMLLPHSSLFNDPFFQLIVCLPVFAVGCLYFGKSAWNSVKAGFPNMDVLIMIGAGAAFAYSVAGTWLYLGSHEVHNYLFYETAATIITLVLMGNVIEHRSVKQTTSAIAELDKLQVNSAKKMILHNGKESVLEVPLEEVTGGDVLMVNTGDKFPVDGSVISGTVSADESMITGESLPVEKKPGDKLIGGSIAVQGAVKMLAEKVGKDTTLSRIIQMVKDAQGSKPSIQRLGDKVSAVFVPVVLAISVLTFFLCHFAFDISLGQSLMNSVAVLVISCPCAMGLATPTAVMVGIGRAARNGILIKGGNSLEEFAKIKRIVFDKTGTLTTGKFRVRKITALQNTPENDLRSLLYQLEQRSSHPIARSIVSELKSTTTATFSFSDIRELKGVGMEGKINDGTIYKIGSYRLAAELTKEDSHTLYILKNDSLIGFVDLEDEIKENALATVSYFSSAGIRPVMVSGDRPERCNEVAATTGIREVHSAQLPDQKLQLISDFSRTEPTAMVGDGINDAPALAKATIGISIGNATQAAIHSSQIVLLNERDLTQLKTAWLISRHTLKTIKQNLFWAFFYNVVAIPIAAAGFLTPMVGALAMAFSDVIVIGNSIRLKYKKLD